MIEDRHEYEHEYEHQYEDEILLEALGQVGGACGGSGGRWGAACAAKRLRKNVHEINLALPLGADESAELVLRTLADAGRLLDPGPSAQPALLGQKTVRAIVGGGFAQMNPVLITVTLLATGPETTNVKVRGAAKEGLIRQRAGEKTARLLAGLLTG